MKKIDIMNINGIETVKASPREGTRCRICGEKIQSWQEAFKTSTPSLASAFVHADCIRTRHYHETFETPEGHTLPLFNRGKATSKNEILFTPECEFDDTFGVLEDDGKKAKFLACYPGYIENDCTVDGEFHPFTHVNLHGLKAWYNGMENFIDMTPDNCGHHINMTWYDCNNNQIAKIERNATYIFAEAENWMESHPSETTKIFGRTFSRWCANDHQYVHGSWCNMVCGLFTKDSAARIEYRLPHYVNATQMTWCVCLLQEWTKDLRAFAIGEQDEKRTSKHILNALIKHSEGRALYQRPERNKQ